MTPARDGALIRARSWLLACPAAPATVPGMNTFAAAQRIIALVDDPSADPAEAARAVGVFVAARPSRDTLVRVRAELDAHADRRPAIAAQVRLLVSVLSGALSAIPYPALDADLSARVLRALDGELLTASELSDLVRRTRPDVLAALHALTERGATERVDGTTPRWRRAAAP